MPEVSSAQLPDKPTLDGEACIACGVCVVACPPSAIQMKSQRSENSIIVAPEISDGCVTCGMCVAVCPASALFFNS